MALMSDCKIAVVSPCRGSSTELPTDGGTENISQTLPASPTLAE